MNIFFGFQFFIDEFALELYAAVFLLSTVLPHRSRFALRVISGSIIYFLLSRLILSVPMTSALLSIAVFALIFLTVLVWSFFCFRQTVCNALFIGTAAYSIQHCYFQAVDIWKMFWDPTGIFPKLLRAAFLMGLYAAFCFVIFRVLRKKVRAGTIDLDNIRVIAMSGIMFMVTLFLSVLAGTLGAEDSRLVIFCKIYSIICCILILFLQVGNLSESELRHAYDMVQRMRYEEHRQYEFSKSNIEALNIKYHDLRHQLSTLKGKDPTEYLETVETMIHHYDAVYHTGNTALDIVLTEKGLICERHHIRFTCMAEGSLLDFMKDEDIYSLFGNALENAIESVRKIEDAGRRVIGVSVKRAGDMCSIHVENYYCGELRFSKGLPITTHEDKNYHGFGMRSMQLNTEKYAGVLSVHTEDDVFYLDILLPLARTTE